MLVWDPLALTQRLESKRNSLNWGGGRPGLLAVGAQSMGGARGCHLSPFTVTHHPSRAGPTGAGAAWKENPLKPRGSSVQIHPGTHRGILLSQPWILGMGIRHLDMTQNSPQNTNKSQDSPHSSPATPFPQELPCPW